MDRSIHSSNKPDQTSLQRLQSDALSHDPETKDGGVTAWCAEAIHSAAYAGLQEPVTGISQIVDQVAGTNLASSTKFIDAPEQTKFASADWHAQQIGGAVGSLLPFMLVHKGVRSALGTEELGMMSARSAFNLNMKEAALTGFAYDSLLKPGKVTKDTSTSQFFMDRGIHGAIGAGTFTTMAAAGIGLKNLAGSSILENSVLAPVLKSPIGNGVLSGIPAGLVNAEANSLTQTGQFASASDLGQSAYSMSLMGGGLGLTHSLRGAEPLTRISEKFSKPGDLTANREGLALAAGADTIGIEASRSSVAPESLAYATPKSSLTELSKRLTEYDTTTESVLVAKPGAPKDFATDREFLQNHLESKDIPMRIYSMEGTFTEIAVPEEYARQLDAVRQFRLGLEGASPQGTQPIEAGLLRRALPEDFLEHLDALPNSEMVRRLVLLNESNPMDPIFAKKTGDPGFKSAATTHHDVITFYKKDIDPYLGEELSHEWSHIARNQQPGPSSTFDLAAEHEGKNYIPRDRALDDKEEYHAVLQGEELLSPDANRFLELTKQVPLQTVVLADGLKESLRTADEQLSNPAAIAAYRSRLDYIEREVRPQVIAKLESEMNSGEINNYSTTAARLLVRLGEINRINASPNFKALDLSGEPVGAGTLADLKSNRTIESLNLSKTYVGSNGIEFVEGMPLKSLDLSYTQTATSALRSIEKVPSLEDLSLRGTPLGDAAATGMIRLSKLKNLDLRDTNFSPKAQEWLRQQMPNTNIEF